MAASAQTPPAAPDGTEQAGTAASAHTGPLAEADIAALYRFTAADRRFLAPFSLTHLPALPPAPANRWADDPGAAALGRALFFDTGLSASGRFACASCHQPARHFTDGLARGQAAGVVRRSTPSVLGAAHSPWLNWDGRADSLWAQALDPIEHPDELATTRAEYVGRLLQRHGDAYRAVFGAPAGLPPAEALREAASPLGDAAARQRWQAWSADQQEAVDRVFSHAGKALMAYQRRLVLPPARFDRFVDALVNGKEGQDDAALRRLVAPDEVAGLRLFMGRARCASCHNGALFTNFEFHNVAAPEADRSRVDLGRHEGVQVLQAHAFSCLSKYSDAGPGQCDEMRFLKTSGPELVGAFKTPSLRNVAATAPYMHAGQFATLAELLAHYNAPQPPFFDPAQHPSRPHFDILPLQLTPAELAQITSFLGTLTSPVPADDRWWSRPASPRDRP